MFWLCGGITFLFICHGAALLPPCDSKIYCTGELLRQIQMAKLFGDNKAFVDMKLTAAPDIVLGAFSNLTQRFRYGTVPPSDLRVFVNTYFVNSGKEFEQWSPPDWHDKPKLLSKISDPKLRSWAEELHSLWKSLGRKISIDVRDSPQMYSMIYCPYPGIVPGGRFNEFYYWDSYWVLNGLILSEMMETARGMIQNFLHMVDRYGFVPNGGRIYYERRSQPPFLPLMVESYYEATEDVDFLKKALPMLENEYNFWMKNRSIVVEVNSVKHVMNRYYVQVGQPRPESYTHDAELAEGLPAEAQEKLWTELKAAAESGWDFSSRWYINNLGQNSGSFRDTRTSSIVPVDLNALICRNERVLATFHRILGDEERALKYDNAVSFRLKAIESVLWDAKKGAWFDYNLLSRTKNSAFYTTNLSPLWARCYSQPEMGQQALQYLRGSGALDYPNGVPTSLSQSGQQWDMPNAWPPLQHMLIEGLSELDSVDAKDLAFDLAQQWIQTNWLAYVKYDAMFEKYDVSGDNKPGGGGEYEVQLGFGWTNGVALQLLDQYGNKLSSAGSVLGSGLQIGLIYTIANVIFYHAPF
ncbi:trehalase isoform X2 [Ictalurus furcatus]|uniref:trehalase isoform X2 n=1 Tax=Ictalurus furcatus TaxID=66913 RepID=UPI002350FB93|nr:trehalase isoform X2 [Ictalurus furcatus]